MKIKSAIGLFIAVIMISALCCGCNFKQNESDLTDASSNSTEKYDIKRYKYINGYATFAKTYKDGYVYFSDSDYVETEEYYGKVRWCDEDNQGTIVSAYQVIAIDDKELYSEPLKIVSTPDDSRWDNFAEYSHTLKAKCKTDANAQCYIKLTDSNNVEYHVMLTPVEKFNNDEYIGSAVYIIDKENNCEFWYDNLIENQND